MLEGELTLIEDGGETVLRAGDCAAFPKGSGNGHHMINRSDAMAVYLEVGTRSPADLTTCSDIDMMSANADGRFVHKDGTPYRGALEALPRADGANGGSRRRVQGHGGADERLQRRFIDRVALAQIDGTPGVAF